MKRNMMQRRYDIDNLRIFCILLLVPYHAAMAFNCWGEANYVWFGESRVLSSFITAVSPWYMASLFLAAGHLWFLLYLFVISMLALRIFGLQRKFIKRIHGKTPSVAGLWILGLLPVLGKPVLDIGGKSIGAYLIFFLLGYYVFYREDVTELLKKYLPFHFGIFLVADVLNVYLFCYCKTGHEILNTVCMFVVQWFGILMIVGFFAKFCEIQNKWTVYLGRNSFPFYIIHFVWIVITQFYLSRYTDRIILLFAVPCLVSYAGTFLCCTLLEKCEKN